MQAPVIMMSQNRQAAKDRINAEHDYEINLKAELEVLGLHTKLDDLREQHLMEIRSALTKQVVLLERIEAMLANREGGKAAV